MVLPAHWLALPLCFLVAGPAAAEPAIRQRQDRRASLPTTASEPFLELYVAAGHLTTVAFNGPLDRDSLVVDRTRFKWVDVGDRILALQPLVDLGSGERLFVKIGFKDRALPTQAVLAVVTDSKVVDGNVEVDRRANTPEALLATLARKEAELEELKARLAGSGPANLVLSEWLNKHMLPIAFSMPVVPAGTSGLEVLESIGYEGKSSSLVAIRLRNVPGQKRWVLGQARLTSGTGVPVKVLAAQMKLEHLEPGEEGLVVVETKTPPWGPKAFGVEMVDSSGQRRLSFNLKTK
ncbi:DUF2381 family protein [Stigmatella hybrida]|uniref:DUF2381 family protein n=1 Tax=Stigmatella hybrida TaxID=394097 RepID=UPI001CDAF9AD|nr:DUF2381 family protein [Stigmatella hybrida]